MSKRQRLKIREDFLLYARPHIDKKELSLITDVVRSGWWTTGDMVKEFERKLSNYLSEGSGGEKIEVLALDSCTSALYLSLLLLGVGRGDEVIVPTWTFVATGHVVEWCGAELVLCDVEEDSLNIDLKKAKELITERTKAIILVHFGGGACDIEGFMKLSSRYGIEVVEDAAHAIGGKYMNKRIGNYSEYTCFSFYVTKNLAMGEGGALVSSNEEVINKGRKLSYFGVSKDAYNRYRENNSWSYDVTELGYKCNMDNLNASLGLVQLNKLERMQKRRKELARRYRDYLDKSIVFLQDKEDHANHLFTIRIPRWLMGRDKFIEELKGRNIGASVHFKPLHKQSYYKSKFKDAEDRFMVSNNAYEEVVSLPLYPSMSDYDVDYVIEHVNDILWGYK